MPSPTGWKRRAGETVLVAGCSEEQAQFAWDLTVLLTAPTYIVADRLRTRTTNQYGRHPDELEQVLADREQVEPLLRRSADLVVETRRPVAEVADAVLAAVRARAQNA